jgi:hypothetical protein
MSATTKVVVAAIAYLLSYSIADASNVAFASLAFVVVFHAIAFADDAPALIVLVPWMLVVNVYMPLRFM